MTSGVHRLARIIAILFLALTVVACGGDAEVQPTAQPSPTATSAPPPTEAADEDDGVVRTVWNKTGDAGGWVWNGIRWVWDTGSDGVGFVWGGVSGGGGWLWDRVTGLPGEVGDLFARFWRWIKGSGLGEAARQTVETVQTVASAVSDFSISGFLWRLVRYVLYAALAVIVVWLLLSRMVLPFIGGLPGRVMRTAGQSVARGRQGERQRAGTSDTGPGNRAVRPHVPRVHATNPPIPVGDGSRDGTAIPDPRWSKAQILELKRNVANPSIIALFDLARSSDGEPVNYRELIEVTGRTANQVRADFAAFSHACRIIHNDDVWPVDLVPATDGSSRRAYVIHDQYVDWWFGY